MFKWLIKWFDSEFPPIVDPLPRVNPVVVAEPPPPPVLSIDEQERALNLPEFQRNDLRRLRKFLKILSEKEIIGWKSNIKDDEDYDVYMSFMYETHYDVTFWSSDLTEFHVRLWDALGAGTMHFLSFSAHQFITAAAQGHLFDEPTILREAEYKTLVCESLAYDNSRYGNKEEHVKYLKGVINRTVDHVKAILEDVPKKEREQHTTPVFHKLWEQMDLPLDTGTEMVKL